MGWTALNVASRHGQKQLVILLLEAQGSVKLGASSGHTPLTSAAELGYAEIVKTLLQSGADMRMVTSKGRTALHLAAENGHVQVGWGGGGEGGHSPGRHGYISESGISVVPTNLVVKCIPENYAVFRPT